MIAFPLVHRLAYNGDVVAFKMGRRLGNVSACRRIGVWAFAKSHQVRAGLLVNIAMWKSSLIPRTPLRRYADPPTRFPCRRPIFNATLRAAASWLFFRVARSTRMIQIWALRYRQSGSDRLEKQPTDLRRRHHYIRCTSSLWINYC